MPGSSLGECSLIRFLSLMYTLDLNGSRVRKIVVGMTNASEDGRLRGIGTDRVSKEQSGRRERRFFGFLFCFQPPEKTVPPFCNHTPGRKSGKENLEKGRQKKI